MFFFTVIFLSQFPLQFTERGESCFAILLNTRKIGSFVGTERSTIDLHTETMVKYLCLIFSREIFLEIHDCEMMNERKTKEKTCANSFLSRSSKEALRFDLSL